MNDKERLQLEEELLMTCSKAQAINKYIDELEESSKLSELWYKSQQENEKYKEVIDKIDKKINDFIKCCKAEKIESGSDFLHHSYWNMFENFNKQIKEILKGGKNEDNN